MPSDCHSLFGPKPSEQPVLIPSGILQSGPCLPEDGTLPTARKRWSLLSGGRPGGRDLLACPEWVDRPRAFSTPGTGPKAADLGWGRGGLRNKLLPRVHFQLSLRVQVSLCSISVSTTGDSSVPLRQGDVSAHEDRSQNLGAAGHAATQIGTEGEGREEARLGVLTVTAMGGRKGHH